MSKTNDATEATGTVERRAAELTLSTDSVLRSLADAQRTLVNESVRAASETTSALLHVQTPALEASLRFIDAASERSRQVLDFWLGTTQKTQRSMLEMWHLGSRQAERVLETSEQTARHVTDRITREAEDVVEDAQAAVHHRELELQREQERERRQVRIRLEREQEEREAAERDTINVVKREDNWAVVRNNASRASGVFDTKREAVERARELARRDNAELHIGTVAEGAGAEPNAGVATGKEHRPEQSDKKPTT